MSECKYCGIERLKEWREKNKEKYTEQQKRSIEKRKANGWAYNLKYRKDRYVKHPKITIPPEVVKSNDVEAKKAWKKNNPQQVRAHSSLRRARLKGAKECEKIIPDTVFKRDNGICGICRKEVKGKYELDHIIPLSKEGNHTYKNIQLAHPKCNRSKHNKINLQ